MSAPQIDEEGSTGRDNGPKVDRSHIIGKGDPEISEGSGGRPSRFVSSLKRGFSKQVGGTKLAIRKSFKPTDAEIVAKTAHVTRRAQLAEAQARLRKAKSGQYSSVSRIIGPAPRQRSRRRTTRYYAPAQSYEVREPVDLTLGGLLGGGGRSQVQQRKKKKVDFTLNGLL